MKKLLSLILVGVLCSSAVLAGVNNPSAGWQWTGTNIWFAGWVGIGAAPNAPLDVSITNGAGFSGLFDGAVGFGAGTNYWFTYNLGGTQWEFWSTDVDGGGTDGLIWSVDDGTDDVDFDGGISLSSGATVDNIETTLSDDDTHIGTSGAIIDYAGGLAAANTWTNLNTFSGSLDKMLDVITTGTNGPAVRIVVPDSMAGNADCLLVEQADGTDIFKVDEDKDVYIGRNLDCYGAWNVYNGLPTIYLYDTTGGDKHTLIQSDDGVFTIGTDTVAVPDTYTDLITVTSNAANASITTLTGWGGGILQLKECSAQPADPAEGHSVIWQSDGTGFGNDGDLCIITAAGGALYTNTIVNVVP